MKKEKNYFNIGDIIVHKDYLNPTTIKLHIGIITNIYFNRPDSTNAIVYKIKNVNDSVDYSWTLNEKFIFSEIANGKINVYYKT